MADSNLIGLFKTLSLDEIKKLEEFVVSPYFNKSKRVVKLFKIIKKYHPDYESNNLSKQKIHKKLFPGKRYNDNTLRVLNHYLMELTEKFLAVKRFENTRFEKDLYLIYELVERKQHKLSHKISRQSLNLLESEIKNDDYFYFKYRIEYENFNSFTIFNAGIYEKLFNETNVNDFINDLTYFYILKCVRSYSMVLNLKQIYNRFFDTSAFENVFSKIDISLYRNVPAIAIYYYLIRMLTESEEESYYYKLKELFIKNKKSLDIFDLTNTYIGLGNYCTRKVNQGKKEFRKERFMIYKEELKDKTYLINGYMSSRYYLNVVNAGLHLGEFSWVKNFIQDYKNEIQKDFRSNLYYHCSALYQFYVKDYETCLVSLSHVKYEDVYLNLQIRSLQIMVYYETGLEELLRSSLDASRHFINSNKLIPPEQKNTFLNFLKSINILINSENKNDNFKLNQLRNNLAKEKTAHKDWLLEKIYVLVG
jgi:hypothetical protein